MLKHNKYYGVKQVALNVFEMLGAVRKKISYFGDNKASIHGKSETVIIIEWPDGKCVV